MKRILSLFLCLVLLFGISMQAYATGDPNIDGGGGGIETTLIMVKPS